LGLKKPQYVTVQQRGILVNSLTAEPAT
jgi:hypothetical protein